MGPINPRGCTYFRQDNAGLQLMQYDCKLTIERQRLSLLLFPIQTIAAPHNLVMYSSTWYTWQLNAFLLQCTTDIMVTAGNGTWYLDYAMQLCMPPWIDTIIGPGAYATCMDFSIL